MPTTDERIAALQELIVDAEARVEGARIALKNEEKILLSLKKKLHRQRVVARLDSMSPVTLRAEGK